MVYYLLNAIARYSHNSHIALVSLIVVFGCAVTLQAAPIQADPIQATQQTAQIVVTDYLDREVSLDKPAERIIALAPHIVENLFSAGAGDRIVAAVNHSDFPEQANTIPRLGGYNNFSLEAIVAFQPDLVIGWAEGHGGLGNLALQLAALNVPVYMDEPSRLEGVAKSIIDFGILTDSKQAAEQSASAYLERLSALRRAYQDREPVTAFYQVWYEPLQTLSGDHIVSDVIRLCGGVNIFADEPVKAPKINVESVIDLDPDAIIASGMGEARPDWLDNWKRWPSLTAVQRSQLYFVPPDYIQRHTERILKGADVLCKQLDQVRGNRISEVI